MHATLLSRLCDTPWLALAVFALNLASAANAQPIVNGQPMNREQMRAMRAQAMQQKAKQQPDAKKAEPKKDADKSKKDAEKADEKPDKAGDSIKRPDEPPRVPDPRELEVEVVSGRVQFGFNGQPWPDVLQWLANVSKLSLDWQELPSGYLNLTTQRSYTLPEARDLINRHLQSRGYVMLLAGEVLSVAKIDQLDPSLVPRISEDELYDRQPHDFVKVTFQLPSDLDVKQASEDVKQALSKHAKLMPLAATQRLLAIDAVANLRLVSALLNEERLEQEGREVPRRFPLRYARAERVINTLYVVLGLDPASRPSQMELQVQQQKMQLLMQMQQRGKDVGKLLNKDGPPVFLAFNRHDNSILVNAPPEQMEIIERTIKMLDTPAPGVALDQAEEAGARYAKTYELESIEPDALIGSLEEIGNLDPLTDLRGDKKSKVLFARASEADHRRIEAIIKQLDGPKYFVEVFWLRRHPADEVAGTLQALVGGQEEKEEDDSRDRFNYWWGGYRNEDEEEEFVELRVEADIENNRLFVRGSEQQIEEVKAFLVQIGELPGDSENGSRVADRPVRVFEAIDSAATDRLLEQLRASWPALGGGAELKIDDARTPATEPEEKDEKPQPENREQPKNRTTSSKPIRLFRLATAKENTEATTDTKPGASLTVTEDGRLVLTSDDPELLARLEELVGSLRPDEQTFTEFRLKYVAARYVHFKLEDFYDDILSADLKNEYDYFGRFQGTSRQQTTNRLSKRRKLRMVYNVVTNSIVVTNASTAQLREIKRLIDIWDQPPMEGTIFQRRTGMVKVRYSRASVIAAALKDVYRDLLSARDKEFDTDEEKGGGYTTEQLTQIEYSGAESSNQSTSTPTRRTKAIETTFDGTLSIGVDELANMLVISADTELYASVIDMIQKLDEQAKPKTTVQVVRVGVPAGPLREALDDALDRPWPGGKPEQRGSTRGRDGQRDPNAQNNRNGRPSRDRRGR